MPRTAKVLRAACLLWLAACGRATSPAPSPPEGRDPVAPGPGGSGGDTLPADTGRPDSNSDSDSDTGSDPDTDGTADTDAGDTDTDTADTDSSVCAPLVLDEALLQCAPPGGAAGLQILDHLWDPADPTCPEHWQGGGQSAPTAADLIAALSCDTACAWDLHQAVMFLHCGARAEYMVWRSGDPLQTGPGPCPDQLQFHSSAGGGWYPDLAAFQAAHPCP